MMNSAPQQSLRPVFLSLGRYAAAQALVATSAIVALWISTRWGNAAIEMIYLPAVLAAGAWWGFGPAILAAVTSALSYNYFFTAPFYTFRIASAVDIVNMTILFLVAVVTSHLAAAIRKQAQSAQAHAARNATIAGFARRLLSCRSELEIAETVAQNVGGLFDCNSVVMHGLPHPTILAAVPRGIPMTPTDIAAATLTLQTGHTAGHGAGQAGPAEWVFYPIRSDSSVIAAMGLSRDDGFAPVTRDQELLLESLLDQAALALARARSTTPTAPDQAHSGLPRHQASGAA